MINAVWYLLSRALVFTPARTISISELKSLVLKLTFLALKMLVKYGLGIYFEIHPAPSEIPDNLPGQFSLSGLIFLQWAAATLKGLVGFQNKKIYTTFHRHF